MSLFASGRKIRVSELVISIEIIPIYQLSYLQDLIIHNLKEYHFQEGSGIDPSDLGQRIWMSPNDIMKLKKMYLCERKCVFFP